jgi:hypothetical protein
MKMAVRTMMRITTGGDPHQQHIESSTLCISMQGRKRTAHFIDKQEKDPARTKRSGISS